ncbi:MAG: transketolase family protein [Planctomycetes bacterium]|nr:transketolase family protein [Planctomycetota bacterium]
MVREFTIGPATREAYGAALVELGRKNPNVVVLDADLSKSTYTGKFGKEFPDRFFNIGIAEANMVGIAGGLAHSGKIPFCSSFACFLVDKGYDQLRIAVAYPQENVKVVSSHGGISIGEDGPSQQSIEDVALMVTLPGFVVCVPSDAAQARDLVLRAADHKGPVYIRTGRPKVATIYTGGEFPFGKSRQLEDGKDVTIVANGLMVAEALKAHDALKDDGITARVIDSYCVKPLDEEAIISAARDTGALVVAEEHSKIGGLGAMVAQCLAAHFPAPVEQVAVNDTYAESGSPAQLLEKYGLTWKHVVAAARKVLGRKVRPLGNEPPPAGKASESEHHPFEV